jgi:hypothetical protein
MATLGQSTNPLETYARFESSRIGFRFTKDLAIYKPMPAESHHFKSLSCGSHTISSKTENIQNAATILIQAQRGLTLLCGQASPIGISHAANSQPSSIFSVRLTKSSYCRDRG